MTAVTPTSVKNNKTYNVAGFLGGAGSYISWTCALTVQVGNVAGMAYAGAYSAYYGSMAGMTSAFGATTWSNPALNGLGAPFLTYGVGRWVGQLETTMSVNLNYAFSRQLP